MPAIAWANAFNDPNQRGASGGPAAGGDLVPVNAEIDGAEISIGSSAQVNVLFRNDSGRPLTTGQIQVYPSSTVSADITSNQCAGEDLPAGAVCVVTVTVKGLQAGAWRVEMIMRHSGRARIVTAIMTGTIGAGEGATRRFISDIEAIPEELDFGSLENSQPIIKSVVLRNITSEPLEINAIYVEAADRAGYGLKTDCIQLEPGQACIVVVTWSPVLRGQATGVLMVEHTGPTTVTSINLLGEYEPELAAVAATFPEPVPGRGLLVASQDSIDFGTGIGTTSAITVSLVNVGDVPLGITGIKLANSDNGLSISSNGCNEKTILDPVEACPLTLSWSPVREGAIIDDVQITHDGARGILVLPVRGASTAVISQDTKAVRLVTVEDAAIVTDGQAVPAPPGGNVSSQPQETFAMRDDSIDPASVLDGFVVTSHSPKRAIISGPGGSRIVFAGEQVVIGGFLWYVNIRSSGVEFRSGNEKVLLLFDKSLSSVNRTSSQSGSGSSGAATATAPASPASQ